MASPPSQVPSEETRRLSDPGGGLARPLSMSAADFSSSRPDISRLDGASVSLSPPLSRSVVDALDLSRTNNRWTVSSPIEIQSPEQVAQLKPKLVAPAYARERAATESHVGFVKAGSEPTLKIEQVVPAGENCTPVDCDDAAEDVTGSPPHRTVVSSGSTSTRHAANTPLTHAGSPASVVSGATTGVASARIFMPHSQNVDAATEENGSETPIGSAATPAVVAPTFDVIGSPVGSTGLTQSPATLSLQPSLSPPEEDEPERSRLLSDVEMPAPVRPNTANDSVRLPRLPPQPYNTGRPSTAPMMLPSSRESSFISASPIPSRRGRFGSNDLNSDTGTPGSIKKRNRAPQYFWDRPGPGAPSRPLADISAPGFASPLTGDNAVTSADMFAAMPILHSSVGLGNVSGMRDYGRDSFVSVSGAGVSRDTSIDLSRNSTTTVFRTQPLELSIASGNPSRARTPSPPIVDHTCEPEEGKRCIDRCVHANSTRRHVDFISRISRMYPVTTDIENDVHVCSFYIRAELRYISFLRAMRRCGRELVPPPDVALMWHAHMLHPLQYREDYAVLFGDTVHESPPLPMAAPTEDDVLESLRLWNPGSDRSCPRPTRTTTGHGLGFYSSKSPLKEHVMMGGAGGDKGVGRTSRDIVFNSATRADADDDLPEEPFFTRPGDRWAHELICPFCQGAVAVEDVVAVEMRLFAKDIACPKCGTPVGQESLSLRRFINDCETLLENEGNESANVAGMGVAGVGRTRRFLLPRGLLVNKATGDFQLARAVEVGLSLIRPINLANAKNSITWDTTISELLAGLRANRDAVRRNELDDMVAAYRGIITPLSVDLVGQVRKTRPFWQRTLSEVPRMTPQDVEDGIGRYDKFLALLATRPDATRLIPAPDIELVWATHQLHPSRYALYIRSRVGRFVFNTFAEDKWDNALARTAELWRREYRTPYTAHWTAVRYVKSRWRLFFLGLLIFPLGIYLCYKAFQLKRLNRRDEHEHDARIPQTPRAGSTSVVTPHSDATSASLGEGRPPPAKGFDNNDGSVEIEMGEMTVLTPTPPHTGIGTGQRFMV